MTEFVDPDLASQTTLDSGALTLLGMVVHQFTEPGRYLGTVWEGERAVAHFRLESDVGHTMPQTDIDLAALASGALEAPPGGGMGKGEAAFDVNPGGYVLFYVSKGKGGYAVTVSPGTGTDGKPVFDSRELQQGDLFVSHLVRPGQYAVNNLVARQTLSLKVTRAPRLRLHGALPLKPLQIEAHAHGFNQPVAELQAMQGKVYKIQSPSRIRIELVAPDDPD
jgi:hypothetical protein